MHRRASLPQECLICKSSEPLYEFATQSGAFFCCQACGLLMCDPTQSQISLSTEQFWQQEARTAIHSLADDEKIAYLDEIQRHAPAGRLLEIGCGSGVFLAAARDRGYDVTGYDGETTLAQAARDRLGDRIVLSDRTFSEEFEPQSFDIIVLFDLLGLFPEPTQILKELHQLLKPDGILLISTSVLDSPPPRLFRQAWVEFYKGFFCFFNTQNIQNALFNAGFDRTLVQRHQRTTTPKKLSEYLAHYRVPPWLKLLLVLERLLPTAIQQHRFKATGGHAVVISRARTVPAIPIVSVVVPAYNEMATFRILMDQLIAQQVPGLHKEILIVESNSTDGTRDEVLSYSHHPNVQIILQDRPRGKGNAVRAGLAAATGDFIIIQDADLEYDLNDYDLLLKPLVAGQHAFVIGSRHSTANRWKMRQFNDAPVVASFFNFGHFIFLTLFNLMYRQRLKDPFSMFKVFRRECLYGLTFECNRFDFDFEIVIKLLRKGYQPVEIPINYTARSFSEGKKVSAWRDPITWVRALVKFRLQPLEINIEPMLADKDAQAKILGI